MVLLRELIEIPTSVGDSDFVVKASEGADLGRYVVTDDLKRNFAEALGTVGHAVTTGRSQAKFLHGSFGSGKSHFMAVLREILHHNPEARAVHGLAEPIKAADAWLQNRKILNLTFHMLEARSVEQAILEGYLRQIVQRHPDAPVPAVHRSDALLESAAMYRDDVGDDKFFARLRGSSAGPGGGDTGLAALRAQSQGWTAQTYAEAAASLPGTPDRDRLVSALSSTVFKESLRSAEYLDLDTGLAVITRHAKALGYHAMVFFLDELILWLSTRIADHTFVQTEGAKLNKLVESSDASRPLPIVSFVARQRNLEDFLGPQVGGTERAALADVMRSVQGRFGTDIVLADTNLPEITEKRLLKTDDAGRRQIDAAFDAVRGNSEVWDTLLLGAQYGDAGIGSDATAFRRLYPFSPALVATLVALSQALQRERTALKVMTELLVARRDTLQVNDLIGVAALFGPLVLHGELPDRPELKQKFQAARDTYLKKFRRVLLAQHNITEEQAPTHEEFALDDRLVKTLILGFLVPEVPALHNLTAAKLHALNFGAIDSPIPGYENQIVLGRLRQLSADAGELHLAEGPDPVISVKVTSADFDKLLDSVPNGETTTGVLQQLVRDLICDELGLDGRDGSFGEYPYMREWRGRKHLVNVRFGNVRDRDTMPDATFVADGDAWRVIVDYPFDPGRRRNEDFARMETLARGSRTVLWMPYFLTDDVMGRVGQLAKINYLLSGPSGDRIKIVAADESAVYRQQAKAYLVQRQHQLRSALLVALKQAYGAAIADPATVEDDSLGVLHTLAEGLHVGNPIGGTLADAFLNLTQQLLAWSYPGKPALPDDEKAISRAELGRVLKYARMAAADPTKGVAVDIADQRTIRRICNPLRLGELVDHRYVLTSTTCWWTGHLLQGAAKQDYKEHFPVHVLRSLLDEPEPRGLDRDLQNLVIAVFAEEQQLAWTVNNGPTRVEAVQAITDQMTLRQPTMPSETAWTEAKTKGEGIFGKALPAWRSPSNVIEMATAVRQEAIRYAPATATLVAELERHADALGLDTAANTGRLHTARRVAALLETVAAETDDTVLIEQLAQAETGVQDAVAGNVFITAAGVTGALASAQWALLDAVRQRAEAGEDAARVIIDELRYVARHDQQAADLMKGLRAASDSAARLLAGPATRTDQKQQVPIDDHRGEVARDVEEPRSTRDRVVADLTTLASLNEELEAEVRAGRTLTVRWEAR
jgi:hypothetical protein